MVFCYFELIVGRLFQEAGYQIEYERILADGKQPDFVVHTPIGEVVVEAMAPVMNSNVGKFYKQNIHCLTLLQRKYRMIGLQ